MTTNQNYHLVDPLTDEEHYARAMLLGMTYRASMGYYVDHRRTNKTGGFLCVDVITLQALERNEKRERFKSDKERYYDRAVCISETQDAGGA